MLMINYALPQVSLNFYLVKLYRERGNTISMVNILAALFMKYMKIKKEPFSTPF